MEFLFIDQARKVFGQIYVIAIGHSIKQSRSKKFMYFSCRFYLGKIKPPINSFLREFVQELNELLPRDWYFN